jgi:copper chaperone CopZ
MINKKHSFAALVAVILLFCVMQTQAQFKWAMVGVNGLTCSACSRTVEMAIRKLPFVKTVQMNLDNTEGKIIFVDNANVDIEKIAKAVTNAGFSVRYLNADFAFNNVKVSSGYCFNNGAYTLQFINTAAKTLSGESQIKFVGPEFLPKEELKKYKDQLIIACTESKGKVYFVTL